MARFYPLTEDDPIFEKARGNHQHYLQSGRLAFYGRWVWDDERTTHRPNSKSRSHQKRHEERSRNRREHRALKEALYYQD